MRARYVREKPRTSRTTAQPLGPAVALARARATKYYWRSRGDNKRGPAIGDLVKIEALRFNRSSVMLLAGARFRETVFHLSAQPRGPASRAGTKRVRRAGPRDSKHRSCDGRGNPEPGSSRRRDQSRSR